MKNRFAVISVIILSLFIAEFSNAQATALKQGWKKIGSQKVSYKLDRDVFKVGPQKGKFSKLKLHVTAGDLNIHKMIVEYANGQKETVMVRKRFKAGTGSKLIDLNGGKRVIKDITFYYDSRNGSSKKAILHVGGKA